MVIAQDVLNPSILYTFCSTNLQFSVLIINKQIINNGNISKWIWSRRISIRYNIHWIVISIVVFSLYTDVELYQKIIISKDSEINELQKELQEKGERIELLVSKLEKDRKDVGIQYDPTAGE